MKDSVILGTGTSKLLKSGNVPNNFAEFRQALLNGTLPVDITTDSAGYSQVGTALNKANLLSDQAAIDVWKNTNVPSNPVLSDAFQKLADRGSTLETDVSAIQTLLGDTAMTSDMGTVSDSVLRHEREIIGWIPDLPVTNIDQLPQNNINGTFWLNVFAQAVSGTMPVSTGQGLLICKRQTTTYWRQVFIGITGASARKFRYYASDTATWSAWKDWDDDLTYWSIMPNSLSWMGTTKHINGHRSGRVVQMRMNLLISSNIPTASLQTIGTLDEANRPQTEILLAVPILNNSSKSSVIVQIQTTGAICVYAYADATSTTGWLRTNVTWLI